MQIKPCLILVDQSTGETVDTIDEALFIPRVGESLQFVHQSYMIHDVYYEIDEMGEMTRTVRLMVDTK